MGLHRVLFLLGAALIAGVLNSVAGGGSFISFPALIVTGIPPINANATNTAALWPGTVAATGAYRRALSEEGRRFLVPLIITGVIGGLIGAVVLLKTSQATFMALIPWLLLGSTLIFLFSGRITAWIHSRTAVMRNSSRVGTLAAILLQLLIALYIGFFGAGAGILMLAMLALLGIKSIHTMNGLKTLLVSIANGMALLAFIAARAIVWPEALLMVAGAAVGGYAGAYYAQKIAPRRVRQIVIVIGFAMSAYFFLR